MKIHSKFHDYYDIGLSYGIDDTIHFDRQTTQIKYNGKDVDDLLNTQCFCNQPYHYIQCQTPWLRPQYSLPAQLEIARHIILFCGKQYNVIQLSVDASFNTDKYLKLVNERQHLRDRLVELKQTELVSGIDAPTTKYLWRVPVGKKLVNWLDNPTLSSQKIDDIHRQFKSAIVVLSAPIRLNDPWLVTINGCLGDIGFMQIVDSFTAFQQISMYLSNQLATENKPPVVLQDVDKVKKHGFDKQSFRTRK